MSYTYFMWLIYFVQDLHQLPSSGLLNIWDSGSAQWWMSFVCILQYMNEHYIITDFYLYIYTEVFVIFICFTII